MNRFGKMTVPGAAFMLFGLAMPAFAQNGPADNPPPRYSGNVDASGMPTDHSTPAERAQTRVLNREIIDANRAADARAAAQHQAYEAQREEYSEQKARYQDAMGRHARQQDAYAAARNAYGLQRAGYNAALARHRHDWPDTVQWAVAAAAPDPVGMPVQFLDGTPAGTVTGIARGQNGQAQAFLLQLSGGANAWIEGADLRFDAAGGKGGVLMTDLDVLDVQAMAGQASLQ